MIRRIATLLVCLVAALISGCASVRPPSVREFRETSGKAIKIAEAALTEAQAARQETKELKETTTANFAVANENFQTLAAGVEQATKRAEAAKSLGETTVKLLGKIGRDASVASKEATTGRKATERVAVDAKAAHAALDQKVDTANAVLGGVKTTAEVAVSRASEARDEAIKATAAAKSANAEAQIAGTKADAAGAKADAAGSKAEAASAKAGADTVVEVGKVRKELSDHATEAEKARAGIIAELNRLITRPLP